MQGGLQYTSIAAALLAVCGAAAGLTAYAGFSLEVDPATLISRFPRSEHELTGADGRILSLRDGGEQFRKVIARATGRYTIRLSTPEVVGNVYYVEANLTGGALTSLRLSFERPASSIRGGGFAANFERRHPGCAAILTGLRKELGEPSGSGTSHEERLVKQSYIWATTSHRFELMCGHYAGRRTVFAMEAIISRI
jgi:hypothetical protein